MKRRNRDMHGMSLFHFNIRKSVYLPNLIEAWAAASLAIGTLNGEQLTYVKTCFETELNRSRVTTLFPADTYLKIGPGSTAFFNRHFNKLAYTILINSLERISSQNLFVEIIVKKSSCIITAEIRKSSV